MKRPIQPIIKDNGQLRFLENTIVRFLLDSSKNDLNTLRLMPFPEADWEQFMQLIGISISGFEELSFVSDQTYDRVQNRIANRKL